MGVERAIVYVDGFNLYHGLMQARLGNSRWLDLGEMSRSHLGDNREIKLARWRRGRSGLLLRL